MLDRKKMFHLTRMSLNVEGSFSFTIFLLRRYASNYCSLPRPLLKKSFISTCLVIKKKCSIPLRNAAKRMECFQTKPMPEACAYGVCGALAKSTLIYAVVCLYRTLIMRKRTVYVTSAANRAFHPDFSGSAVLWADPLIIAVGSTNRFPILAP